MTDDPAPGDRTPDQLRQALAAHAETIEPSPDGLDRIEERLMNEPQTKNQRWMIGAASIAAALLIGAVAFVATNDDDTGVATQTTSTTSTTAETTTSTTAETTTTTEAPFTTDVDPYSVAYPSPLISQRFDSPDAVAANYATEVLGFTELVQSEFLEGDSRSGEFEITDREGNPTTTVFVRQMEDDTWYVLGSEASDVTVEKPEAGDAVTAPFETAGVALAFEGNVNVTVRTQDDSQPIGEGFVTGNGTPPAGPFVGEIDFTPPSEETPGIVIYRTLSAEDGHVLQASSFPIRLQAG